MKRIERVMMIAVTAAGLTLAAPVQTASNPAPQTAPAASEQAVSQNEAKPLIDAIAAIGGIIANSDKPEGDAAKPSELVEKAGPVTAAADAKKADPANGEPKASKKPRSVKNSVILITSGAAAGAALGQVMGKSTKGAIIGAAVGGAVGLIYDRMTYKDPKGI